ncbi:SCO1431 family membrane protein [Streptomyces fimicarius]|uniref:SCO1431 family membrane protein n=1 Tax=Streptomyces griseus TaxID=1911 RepID=UPI0033253AE0
MTATTAAGNARHARHARHARTGGPEDGSKLMEHIAGWAFVVVFAMLVTQIGLL